MIRVRSVWKRYGSRDALAGVSLDVPKGTCCAVLGPNGSGKTTLVRVLSTLARPSEGEVEVAGLALPRHASEVRSRVGVVLDHSLLPRDLALEEGLRYYADLYGLRDAGPRIAALAERLGLTWRLRDPVRTFSRGMAQRAALVRALLHDPEVLLLDEPFTGLDAAACRVVEDVVTSAVAEGRTVLLVTHDLDRAAAVAGSAVLLREGRVVAAGEPHDVARLAGEVMRPREQVAS